MKKTYVSWDDVQRQTQEICRQIDRARWDCDYVVGITRGGLVPGNLISQYLDVPMHTLKVSLRDGEDCETNCWMAEDAFEGKNILLVDDINDSGATINWIKNDWQGACSPNDAKWQKIWNNNVRLAVLYQNESSQSQLSPDYFAEEINKLENPEWIVFPWEEWWQRRYYA